MTTSNNRRTQVHSVRSKDEAEDARWHVTEANRQHDARYGFSLPTGYTAEPEFNRNAYRRLRYPPYIPAIPGFDRNTTTEDEINEWNDRWMAQHVLGWAPRATP